MKETEKELDIVGAWLIVAGTLINAAGESLNLTGHEKLSYKLTGPGNGIEAAGNSLQSIARAGRPEKKASVFGSLLQAAGNSANAASRVFLLNDQKRDGHYIDVIGNAVQTLGAAAEALDASAQKNLTEHKQLTAGYLLLAGGAAVDGISGIYFLKKIPEKGRALSWFGGYLQAVGALLAADAITSDKT
ncbi:DUF6944 family repetitive protein [Metabacillus idriensis]|uniref:DUF6944 family repetitive protein n=1 Tax=Metabacillus idriensis TaxID=324768 RepID=UPI003D297872